MRLAKRSTEVESYYDRSIHVNEFVIAGGYVEILRVAEYMDKNAPSVFLQIKEECLEWGRDFETIEQGEDHLGNDEIGETTFYLSSERGNVARDVKELRAFYRKAKRETRT